MGGVREEEGTVWLFVVLSVADYFSLQIIIDFCVRTCRRGMQTCNYWIGTVEALRG